MSKILGLDLGVSSIGWAVIEEKDKKNSILGMGVRIIPLSTDDADEFTKEEVSYLIHHIFNECIK